MESECVQRPSLQRQSHPFIRAILVWDSPKDWLILSKNESFKPENIYDSGEAYRKLFKNLSDFKGKEETTFQIVGGKSQDLGTKSLLILREFGLKKNDFLVDVGCGYGRLAEVLQVDYTGEYLGTDVVPELLNFAKANFNRQDWNFELVDQQKIPAEDESVDMVCFFSIFTHLLHEQLYLSQGS